MPLVSIHAPRVGCDRDSLARGWRSGSFNSRTPCGVRHLYRGVTWRLHVFQFTHPEWGATRTRLHTIFISWFQFTHPCGVRLLSMVIWYSLICFNSRTPCGVRPTRGRSMGDVLFVSIHAPRVGCDFDYRGDKSQNQLFQFTHPVWGATSFNLLCLQLLSSFNSRTPCGVRQMVQTIVGAMLEVSIHAPRVGCDKWFRLLLVQC